MRNNNFWVRPLGCSPKLQGTSQQRLAEAPADLRVPRSGEGFWPLTLLSLDRACAHLQITMDDMDEPMEDLMLGFDEEGVAPTDASCPDPSQNVRNYITNTFNTILHSLSHPSAGTQPSVTLKRIISVKPYYNDDNNIQLKWHVESREAVYRFPGRNKDEAWRFGRSAHLNFTFVEGKILADHYMSCVVSHTERDRFGTQDWGDCHQARHLLP
jgi:hypothetical protein